MIEILDHVEENYVEDVEFQDLIYGAAAGMVRTLDPSSQFLKPEALKEMKVETEGAFGGIGIRVNVGEDGWLTVVTLRRPNSGIQSWRLSYGQDYHD